MEPHNCRANGGGEFASAGTRNEPRARPFDLGRLRNLAKSRECDDGGMRYPERALGDEQFESSGPGSVEQSFQPTAEAPPRPITLCADTDTDAPTNRHHRRKHPDD